MNAEVCGARKNVEIGTASESDTHSDCSTGDHAKAIQEWLIMLGVDVTVSFL